MLSNFKIGDRVWISSIDEHGKIVRIAQDDAWVPIYVVELDNGMSEHLCRECEISCSSTEPQTRH